MVHERSACPGRRHCDKPRARVRYCFRVSTHISYFREPGPGDFVDLVTSVYVVGARRTLSGGTQKVTCAVAPPPSPPYHRNDIFVFTNLTKKYIHECFTKKVAVSSSQFS